MRRHMFTLFNSELVLGLCGKEGTHSPLDAPKHSMHTHPGTWQQPKRGGLMSMGSYGVSDRQRSKFLESKVGFN